MGFIDYNNLISYFSDFIEIKNLWKYLVDKTNKLINFMNKIIKINLSLFFINLKLQYILLI